MYKTLVTITIAIAVCVSPLLSAAQTCTALAGGSITEANEYLRHPPSNASASSCVQFAIKRIASLPAEQAIPMLIGYLDLRKPPNENETRGFSFHAPWPSYWYPAVDALFHIGDAAAPELLDFIEQNKSASTVARDNAAYTLLLIKHSDVPSLLHIINERRSANSDPQADARLYAAGQYFVRFCIPRLKAQCEAALETPK